MTVGLSTRFMTYLTTCWTALRQAGQPTPAVSIGGSMHLTSLAAGGDSYDSTSRLTTESYQRPQTGPYGETIRYLLKDPHAKAMNAYYVCVDPYSAWDPVTNPIRSRACIWHGAHWGAQDYEDGIHAHWSVEAPDSTGSLQTRFAVDFGSWDASNVLAYGGDRIAIYTNAADFTVNANSGAPSDPNVMRVAGSASYDALLEFSNSTIGRGSERAGGRRWQIGKSKNGEGAGNIGSDFVIRAYDNGGGFASTAMIIYRGSRDFGFGVGDDGAALIYDQGRLNVRWAGAAKHGVYLTNSAALTGSGSFIFADAFASTGRLFSARVQADNYERFVGQIDGKIEWGSGAAARDVELSRSSANVLSMGADDAFRTGRAATGSRPSASAVGQGAQFFDTTLNKPIWSTGSAWVDATGASV